MSDFDILHYLLLALATFFLASTLAKGFRLLMLKRRISTRSKTVIDSFFHKVDKIPAIVECIRKYAPEMENYEELVVLHRTAIVARVSSVYDVLEADARISWKFRFLMKLSLRIREISRDGNFLYVRSLWMFYETVSRKELDALNADIEEYESERRSR